MRRRPMHLRRAAAVFLGLALTASACQSNTGDGTATRGGSDVGVSDGSADDDQGPLSALFGADLDQDAMDDEFRAWQRAVDDLTVACMAAEGFTYHPPSRDDDPSGSVWDLPPAEFAAEHGFGISTLDRSADQADPNAELLAGMTEEEQRAWSIALRGAAPDEDGILDYGSSDPDEAGCRARAANEASADGEERSEAAWQPLIDEINGVHDAVRRDPRVVAAAEEWASCLADAGHPGYSTDGRGGPTPEEAVYERLRAVTSEAQVDDEELQASALGDTDPMGSSASGSGSMTGPDPSSLDADELAEVQAFELELTTADAACRGPYRDVEREVRLEHEQTFVDANRAELEAYLDAMRETEGAG